MISFKEFLTEIKISLAGNNTTKSEALKAFIQDYEDETTPHPFAHRMAIWKNKVSLEITRFDGSIHISSIMSLEEKGKGDGSAALKWLCELADKHQVKMDLSVQPIKNAGAREGKGLNKSQLKAWYKRYGFILSGGDHMHRDPQ